MLTMNLDSLLAFPIAKIVWHHYRYFKYNGVMPSREGKIEQLKDDIILDERSNSPILSPLPKTVLSPESNNCDQRPIMYVQRANYNQHLNTSPQQYYNQQH
jgi:hypothetical protein